ncbi:anaerobic sulfatase maturase [Photobacterium japonica]|uniref:anaerobic sulfatase maturase n=1 Tax=Photobacterium japonica TaxID=2910235 RepID=UPI003D1189C7
MNFNIMAKPASFRCNLKCTYCFYLEKEDYLFSQNKSTSSMPKTVLESYTANYIKSQSSNEINFVWQGGEPLLAGLDFFKEAVKFQKKHANGKIITNTFQTNSIGINKQWAQFFHDHDFLLGISIDGLEDIHNAYRISVNGQPTFERVKQSIDLLKKYNVKFNTLTVVNNKNWHQGKETYRALKALGSQFMQFIPIVEKIQDHYPISYQPENGTVSDFSVPSQGYGQFMTDVFDEWMESDVGTIYVRMFDSILSTWMGWPASVCTQARNCGSAMVVEANGDVYSCDHYVYPSNKIGNVLTNTLTDVATSQQQIEFGNKKQDVGEKCQQCPYLALCFGGCPKHRFVPIENNAKYQNYLCSSYQMIFEHTAPVMHLMKESLHSGGQAADAMPIWASFTSS